MTARRLASGGDGHATLMDTGYSSCYGTVYRTHWWWQSREDNVIRLVRAFLPRRDGRAKILDIGCGDGFIWPRLAAFGSVEGIEPDPVLVAADSPNRSRIEPAGLLEGRDRPADHDLVLMLDVLEHIEDERAALDRVTTLLAPGGMLVLTVPALGLLWSEFDVLSGHHRRYHRAALRAALHRAGLRTLFLRYTYAWAVLPLFARRLLFSADAGEHSHFVKPPARPLNTVLRRLSLVDHAVTRRLPVPFGSSLTAVALKPVNHTDRPE
ncbi:MAG TPA: class I SAM-dependent methyltransferase [Actinophytocola sp.]|uniref:class I SAM-dependent methyltransferase n=1 Tax=Actinophytocola sp. TaxID=1872138 RepID=UPI002DFA576A|nr:class I SAM-dependent methyltransferase [Actinophytocola sp.]